MATITEGTWKISNDVTENTPYGPSHKKVTKSIIIALKNYYGEDQFYQTERTTWNGVIVFDAKYPADTDYAKMRREGIAPF